MNSHSTQNKERSDVLVIGKGIVGLCSAYYLNKAGYSVTIIDRGPSERAASYGNCGLICPSRILPLNDIQLLRKSLIWMFQPSSPFFIRPQANLKLYKWFAQFALNVRNAKRHESMIALNALLKSSRELYSHILQEEDFNCNWQDEGILFVCKKEASFLAMEKEASLLEKELGESATSYIGEELQRKEPALKDDVYGAWLYKMDAHLKPNLFVEDMEKCLLEKGVKMLSGYEVKSIEVIKNRIVCIKTDKGSISSSHYVLAGGAHSVSLAKSIGINLPVVPAKGYSITMKSPELAPKIPCNMRETKVVATPWKDGTYRLGGTMEFTGFNDKINQTRLEALRTAAKDYLKTPSSDEVLEEWFGWRSMTPDGVPIIGRSKKYNNLVIACGHNMLGMSTGTATGKLVSEITSGASPHINSGMYGVR